MNPPPIGEALDAAWNVFKKDYAAILIASLCALLLGLVPLVGGGLAMAGLMKVSLKALRGQSPEPADVPGGGNACFRESVQERRVSIGARSMNCSNFG
jgi:hypothetical protein